jgi:hypothetical protein
MHANHDYTLSNSTRSDDWTADCYSPHCVCGKYIRADRQLAPKLAELEVLFRDPAF